jgi:hypothetical protein
MKIVWIVIFAVSRCYIGISFCNVTEIKTFILENSKCFLWLTSLMEVIRWRFWTAVVSRRRSLSDSDGKQQDTVYWGIMPPPSGRNSETGVSMFFWNVILNLQHKMPYSDCRNHDFYPVMTSGLSETPSGLKNWSTSKNSWNIAPSPYGHVRMMFRRKKNFLFRPT